MRRGFVFSIVLISFVALSANFLFAADMFSGTWKQNIAKSKYSSGQPPTIPIIQEVKVIPDGLKFSTNGINATGLKAHAEWTVTFDGKEHPQIATVDGKPSPSAADTTYSAKKIDDYTIEITIKNKGKVTTVAKNVISKDGKTRTATRIGNDAQGKTASNTIVFEKQ